jgi:uncharacterized SAM-binding protein YcdF (DUF218 family)
MRSENQLDAVVIHGSGMELNSQGEILPPFDSMVRIIAGVRAYELGIAKRLIFSGGHTFGKDLPSEAEVGINFLSTSHPFWGEEAPQIPKSSIWVEKNSKSTRDNIAFLANCIAGSNKVQIGFCTNNYHMPYVLHLARNFNLQATGISAETLAQERNPDLIEFINERYSSPEMRKIKMIQRLLRLELLFDPTAKLPALMANLLRK